MVGRVCEMHSRLYTGPCRNRRASRRDDIPNGQWQTSHRWNLGPALRSRALPADTLLSTPWGILYRSEYREIRRRRRNRFGRCLLTRKRGALRALAPPSGGHGTCGRQQATVERSSCASNGSGNVAVASDSTWLMNGLFASKVPLHAMTG
jgi:hypothetical protein